MFPKFAFIAGLVLATILGIAAVLMRHSGPPAEPAVAIPADDPALGRRVYVRCQACHGIDGRGVPGNYPGLAGSALLTASDPAAAIRLVLNGAPRGAYNGLMPAFPDLADHEIAGVLTWARAQWGNAAAPVEATAVTRLRSP